MPQFTKKHLKEALIDLSPYYEREINEEIDNMVKIIDAAKSKHKTFATQQRVKLRLISHFSAYQHFKDVSEDVLDMFPTEDCSIRVAAYVSCEINYYVVKSIFLKVLTYLVTFEKL